MINYFENERQFESKYLGSEEELKQVLLFTKEIDIELGTLIPLEEIESLKQTDNFYATLYYGISFSKKGVSFKPNGRGGLETKSMLIKNMSDKINKRFLALE